MVWHEWAIYTWRNSFPALSKSVPILNLLWKFSPKKSYHVRCLQTMNALLTCRVSNFTSNVTWSIGLFLPWQTDVVCLCRVVSCWYLQFFLTNSADNRFGGACVSKCCDSLLVDYCVKKFLFIIYMNLEYFLGGILARNLSHLWCLGWVHWSQSIGIHPLPHY